MGIFDYLLFRLRAKNEYGIHSPFLFDLYNSILKDKKNVPAFGVLSDSMFLFRTKKNQAHLPFESALPKRYSKIVSSLLRKFRITSLLNVSFKGGIPFYTLYIKNKSSNSFVKAKENTDLVSILENISSLEMVFFGKEYSNNEMDCGIKELLIRTSENSIFIFETPHNSKESYFSWNTITYLKEITLSLDFYFLGVLFYNKSFSKQSFKLKI